MADAKKSSKTDRHRKSGHNIRYKAEFRWEKNKVRRLRKHLTKFPNDKVAKLSATLTSAKLGKTFQM